MRHLSIVAILALVLGTLWSCVEEPTPTYNEIEQRSLKAWIEKHRPELAANYQEEGGYYVEVLDEGVADSVATSGKDVWVWYDFTARNLAGTIQETRSSELATQLGTYTDYTHYVPAFRFSGADHHTLMEGTYLATFNKLKIGDEELEVRYGTELRLYLPSSVVGSTAETTDGGYEGEFASDGTKPMIVDMKVWGHVGNPVAYEGERVDCFAEANGGLCTEHKAISDEEDKGTEALRRRATRTDGDGKTSDEDKEEEVDTRPLEFFDGRWHQPVDTIEQLLVNYAYSPKRTTLNFRGALGADTLKYPAESAYNAGRIYGNGQLDDIDRRINEALVERFGEGITYDEVLDADSINTKVTANIWYIGRFLDGFIFDTNIDEVKEIIYGEVDSEGKALTFETKAPEENDYILAWECAMPTLRLGQWATILTVSTYGYGIEGKTGSHTTTTTSDTSYYDYANYYNYMNYMNNYYGYGYGNMYNSGYYGYNPYYYGYTPPTTGTTTTTTTTSAEIQSYAPLLFQVFVEK